MIIESMSIITLHLSVDNPCNTTFVDADSGKALYAVKTTHESDQGGKTWTTISRLEGDGEDVILCKSEWRDIQSDLITMAGKTMPSSSWLKKSIIPFIDTVTFKADGGKDYVWKGNNPGSSLELYTHKDKKSPIAKFQKPQRVSRESAEMTTAALLLDERGAEIQDVVVVSWCLLEKSRRARENSTQNRADVLGTPLASVGPTPKLHNGGVM